MTRRLMATSISGGQEKESETLMRPVVFLALIANRIIPGMKSHNKEIGYSKLSFSVPLWMVAMLKERAGDADQTLSQYIRGLVRNDLARAQDGSRNIVNTE
jgi:hypothetical protein